MLKDLSEALSNMEFEEGTPAANKLLWDTIRGCMDTETRKESKRFSDIVKGDQEKRGVHNPMCGELMAAEILAKVGMWLNEKEEGDG